MQPHGKPGKLAAIQEFRRDLRVLEREILRQLEGETSCCAVSLPQCHVLLELSFGGLSLKALADTLNLDKSTLSRTVDALVQGGLVTRAADLTDRRALSLTLSQRGRAKVATINDTCDRYYTSLLEQMRESDRRQVVRAVRLLADGMRRLRGCSPVAALCCVPAPRLSSRVAPRTRAAARRPRKDV